VTTAICLGLHCVNLLIDKTTPYMTVACQLFKSTVGIIFLGVSYGMPLLSPHGT